ncbi:hypothetical protein PaG_00640 [Moesziomyces aphidis]|uniref:Mid2 domain-containing protein n=1 Tax=Moesziomyces aphidis TaxID=84754 RepID=W3VV77_MOEAP|nr:hypothetical protein PaG_00640 [Moesziomyces aphidis]
MKFGWIRAPRVTQIAHDMDDDGPFILSLPVRVVHGAPSVKIEGSVPHAVSMARPSQHTHPWGGCCALVGAERALLQPPHLFAWWQPPLAASFPTRSKGQLPYIPPARFRDCASSHPHCTLRSVAEMVKLAAWLAGRPVAMQLLVCIVIGLRMVSATVQAFTCSLRQTPSVAQTQEPHPLMTNSWQQPQYGKQSPKAQARAVRHRPQQVAADFSEQNRDVPTGALLQQQDEAPSSSLSTGLATGSSSSSLGLPRSSADPSGSSSSLDPHSLDEDELGSVNSTLSDSPLPLASTSASPALDPPATSSNLPIPNPPAQQNGGGQTNTTAPNPSTTSSNTASQARPIQGQEQDGRSRSTSRTQAIVAGVTVPVGVVALGLVAFLILHKQRRQRAQSAEIQRGDSDPEQGVSSSSSPADAATQETLGEAHGAAEEAASETSTVVPHVPINEQIEELDEEHADTEIADGDAAQRGRSQAGVTSEAEGSRGAVGRPSPPQGRARSLKRKPPPPLTASIDAMPSRPTLLQQDQSRAQ